jgi:hypothetical protein
MNKNNNNNNKLNQNFVTGFADAVKKNKSTLAKSSLCTALVV